MNVISKKPDYFSALSGGCYRLLDSLLKVLDQCSPSSSELGRGPLNPIVQPLDVLFETDYKFEMIDYYFYND
jgi:hypothetical protein